MKTYISLSAVILLLLLGSISVGVGQGGIQPMFVPVLLDDDSCNSSSTTCDPPYGDCATTTFYGSGGSYRVTAKMDCSPPQSNCGSCLACVHIIRLSDNVEVLNLHTWCPDGCSTTSQVSLAAAVQYTLLVCRRSCTGNCLDCSPTCLAHAEITGI